MQWIIYIFHISILQFVSIQYLINSWIDFGFSPELVDRRDSMAA